jgi:superfamily II DNA or RNA helicase
MSSRDPDPAVGSLWRALTAASDPPRGIPLALGLDLQQRSARGRSPWAPKTLTAATARAAAARPADVVLAVRPLMPSPSTGAWVKGEVTWDVLRRPGDRFAAAQARWFAELHGIAREVRTLTTYSDLADWLVLDTVESRLLWPHLAEADRLGIPLVGVRPGSTVELHAEAAVELAVLPADDGGLELSPRVSVGGERVERGTPRPIGATGLYAYQFARGGLMIGLAPATIGRAARDLLAAATPVAAVPASERGEFLEQHFHALARRERVHADPRVRIPAPPRPVLRVRATTGEDNRVDLWSTWAYPGTPDAPFGADGASHRDPEAEEAVLAAVAAVWPRAGDDDFAGSHTAQGLDAADLVAHVLPALEALEGVRVDVHGTPGRFRELTGRPEIVVSTVETTDPDWFDLGIIVTIDGRRIPFTPLFSALTLRRSRMMLADGAHFSLRHPALDRLRELIDEAAELAEWETGPRISRYQQSLWADFEDLADQSEPAVSWRAAAEALRGVRTVPDAPVPVGLAASLRPYQRDGFSWLAFLWANRLGGILADDMGLGKTLQVLTLFLHARAAGEARPFLVVAPTSVLGVWREEAARFAPGLRVTVADTTGALEDVTDAAGADRSDVVVTSYAVLRLDERAFQDVDWAMLILDEAQFVKNPATRAHRAAAGLRADAVYALTGTPLENTLSELWAILALTAPGLFPSAARFRRDYIGPIEKGKVPENQEGGAFRTARLSRLRRRIRPFVLRRRKEDVAVELPAKQEQLLHVELGAAHRALYDTVLQRERQKILGLLADLDRNRFIVFRSITLLRLLSLAPGLVDPERAGIRSAKLDALVDQLSDVAAEGHRALVFSQFTSFLDLVEERLNAEGIAHVRLDGGTRRREEVVARFRDGDEPVFLVSLKAGGFGLTLTEADYVFLLDPWWNPAAESQAVDRTHRIGQTRPVFVYRLIATGTIEEKVVALQERKARLFHAVMDAGEPFARALTADDIRGLFDA